MSDQFNGNVRVKDGTKAPQEYGVNREVEISVAFQTDTQTGLESAINFAGTVANNKVNELLGRSTVAAPAAPATTEKAPRAPRGSNKPPTPAPAATSELAPPAEKAVVPETKAAGAGVPDVLNVPANDTGMAISTGDERSDPNAPPADLFTSSVPEINDSHLMSAITRVNGQTKNSASIRALISRYVPQDGKSHQAVEIAADKRQAFLTELEKTAKAA